MEAINHAADWKDDDNRHSPPPGGQVNQLVEKTPAVFSRQAFQNKSDICKNSIEKSCDLQVLLLDGVKCESMFSSGPAS